MAAEYVAPSPGTGTAHPRAAGVPQPGRRADVPVVVRVGGPPAYEETETADSFEVHALAVGPVQSFPDARTAEEADRVVTVLERLGGVPVGPLPGRRIPRGRTRPTNGC